MTRLEIQGVFKAISRMKQQCEFHHVMNALDAMLDTAPNIAEDVILFAMSVHDQLEADEEFETEELEPIHEC